MANNFSKATTAVTMLVTLWEHDILNNGTCGWNRGHINTSIKHCLGRIHTAGNGVNGGTKVLRLVTHGQNAGHSHLRRERHGGKIKFCSQGCKKLEKSMREMLLSLAWKMWNFSQPLWSPWERFHGRMIAGTSRDHCTWQLARKLYRFSRFSR